ncbi:MAG: hypothetical protein EPN93_20060 [Spirochaetes bacterium]|nr:MAG: hypothetical protein EPN93_20060 [Spirochaetota bacterium]
MPRIGQENRVDIRINSCEVNFELEHERAVTDVVRSISDWAKERDLVFVEARLDDTSYSVDDVPDVPLDQVKVLNCVVQSRADVVIAAIEGGIAYCDRAIRFMDSFSAEGDGPGPDLGSLGAGMDWLAEVIRTALSLLELDPAATGYRDTTVQHTIEALKAAHESLKGVRSPREAARFFSGEGASLRHAREILVMLLRSDHVRTLVVRSIDSPDTLIAALKEIMREVPARAEAAGEAALAYQAGKDGEGSVKIDELTDFLYRYFRACNQGMLSFKLEPGEVASDGVTIEEKNAFLQELITRMSEALENNDIISLSDVLEYELRPALEGLDGHVRALLDRMSAE